MYAAGRSCWCMVAEAASGHGQKTTCSGHYCRRSHSCSLHINLVQASNLLEASTLVKASTLVEPSTLVQASTLLEASTLVQASILVQASTLLDASTLVEGSTLVEPRTLLQTNTLLPAPETRALRTPSAASFRVSASARLLPAPALKTKKISKFALLRFQKKKTSARLLGAAPAF